MNSAQNDRSSTYLEQFVESCYFLPTELSRFLNMIKAIDDRCCTLSDSLNETTAELLAMPPAYQHGPSPEYNKLMQKVSSDQKMLTQLSEEKLHLAQQAYDILEMYAIDLERTIENFETDSAIQNGGQPEAMVGPLAAVMENLQDIAQTIAQAGFEVQPSHTIRPEDWNVPLSQDPFLSLPLPTAPGVAPPGWLPAAGALQTAASGGPGQGRQRGAPGRSGSQRRGVKSEDTGQGPTGPTQGSRRRGAAAGTDDGAGSIAAQGSLPMGGIASDAGMGQQGGFVTPPPPGLKEASSRPQVPGQLLSVHDINAGLKGRHAELYWPNDMSWYLIEIQEVDFSTHTAVICYVSGEKETLDLKEIAQERHMSLIPPEFYGARS